MATRDATYQHFGPILLEAIALVLLEEINALRVNQGMEPIQPWQFLNQLNNHLSSLPPYDWQTEPGAPPQ